MESGANESEVARVSGNVRKVRQDLVSQEGVASIKAERIDTRSGEVGGIGGR